jgi:hypothetical protein
VSLPPHGLDEPDGHRQGVDVLDLGGQRREVLPIGDVADDR